MANELDELTGPINTAGNSNSKIMNFFGSNGIKEASTAFGTVGSAAIKKTQIVVVAANNNEQVTPQEMSINKPLVNMVNALASIDSLIKQRLENFKIITANERLARRESQVEQQTGPQIEVIQQDAEKVSGSNVGLFALGGLALLALDPVQEALKTVFEGVASAGRFITGVASSINDAFRFLLGSEVPGGAEPANTPDTKSPSPPANNTTDAQAVPTPPAETPAVPPQATPEKKPSFLGSMATGAFGGAIVGSFIPKVGAVGGAIVGGVYGAYKYVTGGSTSTPTGTSGASLDAMGNSSSSSSSPDAIGGAVTPVSPGAAGAADAAETQVGMRGSQVGGYLSQGGVALNPAQDQWCSAFVNSSLARGGIQGATNIANSFQSWGVQIDPSKVQKGDVVLQTRGKGPDQVGGHVGIATGRVVEGKVEMIAGNSGKGSGPASRTVKKYFVPINQNLQIRRNDPNAPGITAAPTTTSETNGVVGAIATGGLKMVGELLGMLGSAIIKPGIARTDLAGTISKAATEMNAEVATSKTPKEPKVPTPPTPPNINRAASGATQNPPTAADKTVVYYYLRRFGYQDLNTPEKALPRAVIA